MTFRKKFAVAGVVALALSLVPAVTPAAAPPATAAADSPALTPPLGWNSWNTFYCNIDENKIKSAADAMVSSGMKDAGYEYVVVDDCWQATERAADGSLQADPVRFPSGMKALGDYIHAKGLKFGIYQAPRTKTCAQFFGALGGSTGALGHEQQDADTFASWGVDYLKYDWCSDEGDLQTQIDSFTLMRDALRATGRPIVYSINPNSIRPNRGAEYYWGDIADLWRTTEDITAAWRSGCTADCFMGVTEILDVQANLTSWNGPGHWNDPDMLEVGKGNILSPSENRAHFAMWALMGSPLIAGNDITTMNADTRSILTNKDIIAVDQDPKGAQAARVKDLGDVEVWAKPMSDGSVAVGLLNRGDSPTTITATAAEIGLGAASNYVAKNLYTGAVTNSGGTFSAAVSKHNVAILRITPGAPQATTTFSLQGVQSGRCLDGENGVLDYATPAVIRDCDTSSLTQRLALSNGQLMVGGMCLDVDRSQTAPGTAVLFWECNSQSNQQWTINADGSVKSVLANLCLDVGGAATAVGSRLVLWHCTGAANQQWTRVVDETPTDVSGTTVTPTVSGEPAGSDGWMRGAATVSLEPSNAAVSTQYRVDGGAWSAYSAPVSFPDDGAKTIDYRATYRGATVAGSEGTVAVKVDATAPTTTVRTTPASGTATQGDTLTVLFDAVDATSGVARTEYFVNGGAWTAATAAGVSFTAVGTYQVAYRSVDAAGNVEAEKTVAARVVARASTASVAITSADPASSDGWYQQSVLVALSVPSGSTGLTVQYRVNGGGWTTYRNAITVSKDGQSVIDHRLLRGGVVVAGSEASTTVKIDKTAPTATVSRTPGSGPGTPLNPIELTVAGRDATSGVTTLEYRVNSGAWTQAAEGKVTLDTVGDYVVSYRATDVAGNVSTAKSTTVTIVPSATPTVKVSPSAPVRGANMTVTVSGFVRWSDVTVRLGDTVIATVLTDQNGAARVSAAVPSTLSAGPTALTATGERNVTASATVSVK